MEPNFNKILMEKIFSELENGNDQLFIDAMNENMQWNWMGSGEWSKSFKGKRTVLNELWTAVKATLVPPYKVIAKNFVGDGDFVVVEALGQNTTPDGKVYHNKYCWVCRFENGKISQLNEYMDTELVTKTFSSPSES